MFHGLYGGFVVLLYIGKQGIHDRLAWCALLKVLPKLLGDEGHERVKQSQQYIEVVQRSIIGGAVDGLSVGWFHHFKVP